jgi:hypothetical protein
MAVKAILLVALAGTCFGETGFEIKLAPKVASENVFGRYLLTGPFGGFSGWLSQAKGIQSYRIETSVDGKPAARLKSILYAPGCELQTFDVALGERDSFEFECRPMASVSLQGKLTKSEALLKRDVEIRVNYVPYWASNFFELGDDLITTIPVVTAVPDADGRFQVNLPAFSPDPSASAVFQFWARERSTGNLLGELVPQESRSKFGGLQIEAGYPREMAFTSCAMPRAAVSAGFAKRGDPDGCGR